MKWFTLALAVTLAIGMAVGFAQAADQIFNTTIASMVIRPDKNGNEYVRMIVPEKRQLNGVEYTVSVPVMAFGDMATEAKNLKPGDTLNAIVQSREYQGRTSYTVLAFIKPAAKP